MNKIIFILMCLITTNLNAQNQDSLKYQAKYFPNTDKIKAQIIPGAEMPMFEMLLQDSTHYNTKTIDKNKSVVLMLFNPNCEHCIEETKSIIKNMDMFPNSQFILITGENMLDYLPSFIKASGYKKNNKMVVGIDLNFVSYSLFAMEGLPQIMVYSTQKKLIDVFYSDTEVGKIVSALNRENNNEILPKEEKKKSKKNKHRKLFSLK